MEPQRRAGWVPPGGVWFFLIALSVSLYSLLHLLHDPSNDPAWSSRERSFDRMIRSWQGKIDQGVLGKRREAKAIPVSLHGRDPAAGEVQPPGEIPAEASSEETSSAAPLQPRVLAYLPPREDLSYLDRDYPALWPAGSGAATPELPRREAWLFARDPLPVDLFAVWLEETRESLVEQSINGLFEIPESLLDSVVGAMKSPHANDPERIQAAGDDSGSLTRRLLDIEQTRPRLRRPFATFLSHLVRQEAKFVGGFDVTSASTPGFEEGTEEVDMEMLQDQQRKVLWDTAKATYLSKYRVRGDGDLRGESFYFDRWRGVDFVVLPVLLSSYAYYRGLEKSASVGPVKAKFYLEPVRELQDMWHENHTEGALLGVEVRFAQMPVRLMASAGIYEGHTEVDFVGIGTSFQQLRGALHRLNGEE